MERCKSKVLGIDLGTTNSGLAYFDEISRKGVCCRNEQGDFVTPSVICINPKKQVIVGSEARECALIYANRTAQLFKRKMGIDKVGIAVDEENYSPQQLSAFVLKELGAFAKEELEEEIKDVIITVPAYFDTNRRAATKEAGRIAGFNVLDILDEPVAVLYNSDSFESLEGKTVLVFDLGGGTLDIIVANVTKDSIDEIAIAGDIYLGGSDFDKALVEYIREKYLKGCSLSIEEEQELVMKSELAKKVLSRKEKTDFTLSVDGERRAINVSRIEFESCTKNLMEKIAKIIENLKIEINEKGVHNIDTIILAGGSTRMPVIEQYFKSAFNNTEISSRDVEQAVAKGAAVYGKAVKNNKQASVLHSFEGKSTKMKKLNRVTSRSYGIVAYVDGREQICRMISKNSMLPLKKEEVFYTYDDSQKSVEIRVNELLTDNKYEDIDKGTQIGVCNLKIGLELPKKSPVSICLSLDESGLMHVHAFENAGNTEIEADIKTSALLSETECLRQKASVHRMLDER